MATKFVFFLFFLVVEGEQVSEVPGNAVQFMRSKFSIRYIFRRPEG